MIDDSSAPSSTGFQISEEPVIKAEPREEPRAGTVADWTGSRNDDSLYILARDPASLFVYWTLDWAARFTAAGLGDVQHPVHLRVFRSDGTEETKLAIDPLVGFAFVSVESPETEYLCELGCRDGDDWTPVARSNSAQTPAATLSDDLSAQFATLPFHLSFQRLIDLFGAAPKSDAVASSVADWQAKARALQASLSPSDWSGLVENASSSPSGSEGADFGLSGARPDEMATLLRTLKEDVTHVSPTPEKLEEWRRLAERFGGSSWSGESSSAFGGASR